jgi:hypothetical protein
VMARPVRREARAAARWTRSSSAETHGLSVPISPMMPGRMPVSSTPSVASRTSSSARSSTERRSIRASPAAAHHDVQPARPRDGRQPGRVPTHAGQREIDDGLPAGRREALQLIGDDRLVPGQLPVIPAVGHVPQADRRVLVGQREAEVRRVDPAANCLDVARWAHEATRPDGRPRAAGYGWAAAGLIASTPSDAAAAKRSWSTASTRRSDSARR